MTNTKNENREHLENIRKELYVIQNGELINEENEPVSLYDYFEDVYDIEYRVDSQREYRGVSLMIACGGPNIYIDTRDHKIKLYWWTEYDEIYLDSSLCDEIDEIFEEYYNC